MNDKEIKKVVEFPIFSGSEDFSYYAEKIPGCFFYIGCKPKGVEKAYFNHHPKFDIDEEALLIVSKSVAQVVCRFMNGTSPLVFVCKKTEKPHKTPFGINERCFVGCNR
ncbi:hypothetical protein KEH51_03685 [[Brevibacterium] frigoritolerans]|uniref:Amidohydrolase n=1 Tax=Peribacillus frigoritolerans TaxID=450367 RepID=A0A941FIN3_9BACI|nr:hypothetical protein [Peribacillus frigoritolerans]